jgi:hypothetical protein
MRRKVFSLLLSLVMLFALSVYMVPAAEASGADINNFGYGILTNNFNLSGNTVIIKTNVYGTNATSSVSNQISGAQTITGNILSGGTGSLKISGTVTQTGGGIYSDGPVDLSGGSPYHVGAVQSLSTITPNPTVSPNTAGTLSQKRSSLTMTVPAAVPSPDSTYYSATSSAFNPTVISAASISQISNGGTYIINGSLDLEGQPTIITITKPTTLVVTGGIIIHNTSINVNPSTGSLALIAFGGIVVYGDSSAQSTLTDVLLWANGYTSIGAPTGINITGYTSFTGDVVATQGVSISGYVAFNQEVAIPVAPPLEGGAPIVMGISPTSGPASGGASVTITGTGFTGATAVKFGNTPATSFTVNSGTSIKATSPVGTGTVDVTVTTPGGTSATSSADQYTYLTTTVTQTPTITTTPIYGGVTTSVSGTAVANASIVLSIKGTAQPAVTANGGNWTVSGLTLTSGDTISVTAQAPGEAISQPATANVTSGGGVSGGGTGGAESFPLLSAPPSYFECY